MAVVIYGLCALTALMCSWLLFQAWRKSGYKLLFWSALCFAGLTSNNLLLIADKLIFPFIDFSMWRLVTALGSMTILIYGLIWDAE